MFSARSLLFFLLTALVVILGCSGGGNPATPENQAGTLDSTPAINMTDAGGASNGLGIMGAYELTINPNEMTAELVPMRASTIGESFIVSGLSFFTIQPCTDCLEITGIELLGNDVILKFRIRHPFEPGDPGTPENPKLPSSTNRLDLDVFDVALVIEPTSGTPINYPLIGTIGTSAFANVVSNSSGYTRELSNVIGIETALPYVLVIDDSVDNEPVVSTWNEFAMGAEADFDVAFHISGETMCIFNMYLTMGYGKSANADPDDPLNRLNPKYYNPEFNRKAAWKVEVTPSGVWVDNNDTTTVDVEVAVYDWQIGATVYGNPNDFANAPPNNVYAASEVLSVSVEIPGMTNSLQQVDGSSYLPGGTGMPDCPLIYELSIANENHLPAGIYTGLAKVIDERLPCSEEFPEDCKRDVLIHSPNGVDLEYYAMPEYATYQTFDATVVNLIWAKRAGGNGSDEGLAVATLSDNSTVITGYFGYPSGGSAIFGPGEPNQTILIADGGCDIFIARYNPDGTLAWAKRAGGNGSDEGLAITTLSDDSIVVTGYFTGTYAVFGPGETNQTTLPPGKFFIAKYNYIDGTLAWAKRAIGSISSGVYFGITTLSDDSTVVTGSFGGNAKFGPGEPNQKILTSAGSSDIFVARYNSTNGTLAWAKHAGGLLEDDGYAITALSDNSTVVTGRFAHSATFGPGEQYETILTCSYATFAIFVARYNPDGTLAWAKYVQEHQSTSNNAGYGITTLSDNSTVVTGIFQFSAIFGLGDPNQTTLTSGATNCDIFIARYNPDGTLDWAKNAGLGDNPLSNEGFGITTLSDNSTVLTGYVSSGDGYAFIARHDPSGERTWYKTIDAIGIPQSLSGYGITTLSDNSTVVTGFFEGIATFGLDEPNETILTSAGGPDIFIARFAQ